MSTATPVQQPTEGDRAGITQEAAFDVLSCQRRRYVLHHLLGGEPTAELRELSEQVAAWENDVPVETVTYDQRMRVYTSLRQLHLPKLDGEGLVDFDENRGTVSLTEDASELEFYLEVVPHEEIRWSKYYLGLATLAVATVVAAGVGVVPLASIPASAWSIAVAGVFWVSAAVHTQHDANNRLGAGEEPPT
ncbi:DUF7344 domain-containing protein [Halobacterium litoreum]|uniref:DUF7344 domain-containing protein n=1 Tax=Halobacterium litoreum TaxID=2039234 RepID=A0ABD5NC93_9EURY|nr:hypothetical protein [Halobacterium litoreum]UHH14245.1 hypothetical protein LT972_04400 [Halobacterium litoreum]